MGGVFQTLTDRLRYIVPIKPAHNVLQSATSGQQFPRQTLEVLNYNHVHLAPCLVAKDKAGWVCELASKQEMTSKQRHVQSQSRLWVCGWAVVVPRWI